MSRSAPTWLVAAVLATALALTLPGTALADDAAPEPAATVATQPDAVTPEEEATPDTDTAGADESGAEQGGADETADDSPAATPSPAPSAEASTPAAEPAAEASSEVATAEGPQVAALASVAAPSPSSAPAAGTYTITANPYVAATDAPIGVNVYLSDPGFPPVTPQQQNATLTVSDDGSMQLALDLEQEVFTLQHLGDGDGAQVLQVVRGSSLNWMGGDPDTAYSDRITRVILALDDAGGQYTFTDVVEYPTLLKTEKTWAIHLAVDFASAVRQITGDAEQTYLDPSTGILVTVATEGGSDVAALLPGATLGAAPVSAGTEHDLVTAAVGRAYVTMPQFTAWSVDLRSGSTSIDLAGRARATVSLPSAVADPQIFLLSGGTLDPLVATSVDAGAVTVETDRLGTFVVVDGGSGTAWYRTKTFTGDVGTTMSYRSTGVYESAFLGMDFDAIDAVGLFSSYLGEETSSERADQARAAVAGADAYQDPEVRLYTFGLDMSFENLPFAETAKHRSFLLPLGNGENSLSGTVPLPSSDAAVYLVSGTVGDGLTSASRLDTATEGSTATFDLVGKDEQTLVTGAMPQLPLWNAATGRNGDIDTAPTPETTIAYVVVVREAPTAVEKPVATQGLVYDGTAQVGVAPGEGYTLDVAPSATAAGAYVARATLTAGHVWSDGSTAPVALAWSIAPAPLTATYAGEQVAAGTAPALTVRVTGFVHRETATSAAGYVAPTVSAPGALDAGRSYPLTPAGGAAANYSFTYRGGVLTVTAADNGTTWQPGTYRITANLFVPAEQNDILHLAAYMTNPKNPLVAPIDPDYGIPTSPVVDNATLVVAADLSTQLVLDLPNPAFTLLDIGTPSDGATVHSVVRDGKTYGSDARGRITRVVLTLDPVGGAVVFAGSHVFAAPLSLDKTWDLTLTVDAASARRISDDTTTPSPDDGSTGSGGGTSTGGTGAGGTTTDTTLTGTSSDPAVATPATGTLRAGTYTVSANVWLSRSDTGLPLDPHLTSGAFPPMDPVQDNATLVVAADGTGRVTVPITIQSRIMTVRTLTGTGVTTAGGEAVTSVTIDLGRLDAAQPVVTRSLTAAVRIGDLAMSIGGPIFGDTREHTWPATFRMDLTGVPTSGGGDVPAWVLTALSDPDAVDAADAERDAADAAAALDATRAANEDSRRAAGSAGADDTADVPVEAEPSRWALPLALALLLLVAAGTAVGVRARRRTRARTAATSPHAGT